MTVRRIQELICDELELSPEVHYGTEPEDGTVMCPSSCYQHPK